MMTVGAMHSFLTLRTPNAAGLAQASICTHKPPHVAGWQLTARTPVARQTYTVHGAWTGIAAQMQRA